MSRPCTSEDSEDDIFIYDLHDSLEGLTLLYSEEGESDEEEEDEEESSWDIISSSDDEEAEHEV